jgi:hypothetical protein
VARLAGLVLLALACVGCFGSGGGRGSIPAPSLGLGEQLSTTMLSASDGGGEMEVDVIDSAGIVRAIAPSAEPSNGPGMTLRRVADDKIAVGWVGGDCDILTTFTLGPEGMDRFRLSKSVIASTAPGALCTAGGRIRSITIQFYRPIDPSFIDLG